MQLTDLLAVARGDAPADVVLRGGQIVNVFSGEVEAAEVAILGGRIAGVGSGYEGRQIVDLDGAYVAPGLIDAHVHIESSLCIPAHFAAAVLPRGITSVVADPHEIANVCGAPGVRFMADSARGLPLSVFLMAPSCVPATPMATAGAALTAGDLADLLRDHSVHGLAEVMNFPGVIHADAAVLAKLAAFGGRPIDGHCPGIVGKALSAYIAAGIGSDHECVSPDEAREKLARGLYILIREATNAHNLSALLPIITEANSRRICFCSDDRQPEDLLGQGSIDYMVREAIRFGIAPVTAWRMATLNTAEWFGLQDRGAIAPGRVADLVVFADLAEPHAAAVYAGGRLVGRDGELVAGGIPEALAVPESLRRTCRRSNRVIDLAVAAKTNRVRVIGLRPDQLVTDAIVLHARIEDGLAVADPGRDLMKMAVVERHRGSGNVGVGFITGFGLKRGAIAGSVAHDHHNIVAVGATDTALLAAISAVEDLGGGLVAVDADGTVMASLPLPVAGLMSDRPIAEVRAAYAMLLGAAGELGSSLHDPFMAMSFMALEVIPQLKLTDQGLVDVERFERVDLFV